MPFRTLTALTVAALPVVFCAGVSAQTTSPSSEFSAAPERMLTTDSMIPVDSLRQWHLGTNTVELGMAIVNLTGEYDFAPRWSGAIGLHYSAWNYGKRTRKFRTFIFRPEVRYWFDEGHRGWFVDAHVQMAAYNFALDRWKYRIQDVDGKHPALGGGLGAGFRSHLDKQRRWSFQAQVGVGVYHLKYHRWVNGGNCCKPVDTRSRTFFGIDNVSLSIVYNFKYKGRR